jgi:tRNA(Ile)-lysidine synthase
MTLPVPGEIDLEGIGRLRSLEFPQPSSLAPCPGPHTAFLLKSRVRGSLGVRPAANGDRYRPAGLPGETKLSELFVNAKVPASRRKSIPVVRDAEGIVWVPGFAPAERVAHPFDDSELIVLVFQPEE